SRLLVAAFFASAALWSKQLEVFLPPAQIAALWLMHGRAAALRYALCVVGVAVTMGLLFVLFFGGSALWFNMWFVPSHHPFPDVGAAFASGVVDFLRTSALLWVLVAATVLWRRRATG